MAAEDWLVEFLRDFASLSEEDRDAAIDALPPANRDAILALAEAREVAPEAGLLQVLDAGQVGLEKLYELREPGDLYTLINLAVRQNPNIVVEALFAAVILHRGWDQEEPSKFSRFANSGTGMCTSSSQRVSARMTAKGKPSVTW